MYFNRSLQKQEIAAYANTTPRHMALTNLIPTPYVTKPKAEHRSRFRANCKRSPTTTTACSPSSAGPANYQNR